MSLSDLNREVPTYEKYELKDKCHDYCVCVFIIDEGAKFDGKCKTGGSIDIGESKETTKPSTTITK